MPAFALARGGGRARGCRSRRGGVAYLRGHKSSAGAAPFDVNTFLLVAAFAFAAFFNGALASAIPTSAIQSGSPSISATASGTAAAGTSSLVVSASASSTAASTEGTAAVSQTPGAVASRASSSFSLGPLSNIAGPQLPPQMPGPVIMPQAQHPQSGNPQNVLQEWPQNVSAGPLSSGNPNSPPQIPGSVGSAQAPPAPNTQQGFPPNAANPAQGISESCGCSCTQQPGVPPSCQCSCSQQPAQQPGVSVQQPGKPQLSSPLSSEQASQNSTSAGLPAGSHGAPSGASAGAQGTQQSGAAGPSATAGASASSIGAGSGTSAAGPSATAGGSAAGSDAAQATGATIGNGAPTGTGGSSGAAVPTGSGSPSATDYPSGTASSFNSGLPSGTEGLSASGTPSGSPTGVNGGTESTPGSTQAPSASQPFGTEATPSYGQNAGVYQPSGASDSVPNSAFSALASLEPDGSGYSPSDSDQSSNPAAYPATASSALDSTPTSLSQYLNPFHNPEINNDEGPFGGSSSASAPGGTSTAIPSSSSGYAAPSVTPPAGCPSCPMARLNKRNAVEETLVQHRKHSLQPQEQLAQPLKHPNANQHANSPTKPQPATQTSSKQPKTRKVLSRKRIEPFDHDQHLQDNHQQTEFPDPDTPIDWDKIAQIELDIGESEKKIKALIRDVDWVQLRTIKRQKQEGVEKGRKPEEDENLKKLSGEIKKEVYTNEERQRVIEQAMKKEHAKMSELVGETVGDLNKQTKANNEAGKENKGSEKGPAPAKPHDDRKKH